MTTAAEWRSKAESLRSEARDAVRNGNAANQAGRREEAQAYWRYASQCETVARQYDERAAAEERN